MFVQVIQGQAADRGGLRDAFDRWHRELAPAAVGWLGSTAGVTAAGDFVALARFESVDAARRNNERPEQHRWWTETARLFQTAAVFHNCHVVDTLFAGGSDQAGFVQVIQGTVSDADRMRELMSQDSGLREFRPDVLGGVTALHDDGSRFTQAVYFTTESQARAGEGREPPPELAALFEEQGRLLSDLRYYDLTEPWLHSPAP